MKNRLNLLAALSIALLAPQVGSAVQVTFQVDMSAQIALGNFQPATEGVFVAGDPLNSWNVSDSPLTENTNSPGIYTGTFEIPADPGTTVSYKFLINKGDSQVWEGAVGTGGGTGNRTFTLAASDQTLPVVYFNNVSSSTSVTCNATFQVNMSVQTSLGNFDPAVDTVSLAGEFNNWSASAFLLERSTTTPDIWSGTLSITGAVNTAVSYKFVINGSTWEGNVGEGGGQNRSFKLTDGDLALPVAYFNNVAAVPTTIPVTFEVDLGVQIARGNFDAAAGTVSVAGDFNSWDTTVNPLTRSATETNVWTGTIDITGTTGLTLLYKFVLDGATWDGVDNRTYSLTSTNAQTVPRAYFSNVGNLGALSMSSITNGQVTLSWTAGPLVRLQTSGDLVNGPWLTVPFTEGQSSMTMNSTDTPLFFRLVGP